MSGTQASKREVALRAAVSCFGRYGYKRTSMETIAHAAGMSRPALYQHFSSKRDAFRAMAECMFDEVVLQAQQASRARGNVADRLYDVLAVRLDLVVGHSEAEFRGELLAEAAAIADGLLAAAHQRLRAVVVHVLESAADELDLLNVALSVDDAATLLVDAVTGIEKSADSADQLHTRLRQLVDLTVRGLTTSR